MQSSKYKKETGFHGEEVALGYYLEEGYCLRDQNYIIRWWELDLIVEKWGLVVFVEVKVVDHVGDIQDFITPRKLFTVKKTIEAYRRKHTLVGIIRLDVVFVKHGSIYEVYENITNQ